MIDDLKDKIIKARVDLIYDQPFFGHLILRFELIEDPDCKTMWTDGEKIGYNLDFVKKINRKELMSVFAHEVLHVVLLHHLRKGKNRDLNIWQYACDYAVNLILIESGFKLPGDPLINYEFKDMSTEKIYELIKNDDFSNYQSPAEIKDIGDKLSESEITKLTQEVKINTVQSAQQAKSIDKLPGFLDKFIENILETKTDWKEILYRFTENISKEDYTWFPPNKRFIHKNLYIPSLSSEELPPFIVAMDTSGSINHETLNQFASELSLILEEFQTSCIVLYCDIKIRNIEEFSQEDLPIKLHPKGGGRTNFIPPFDWIEKNNLNPSCLIYLTDLICHMYPKYEPTYPVLWAYFGSRGITPPFGEIIEI